jgi:hypothetical protein
MASDNFFNFIGASFLMKTKKGHQPQTGNDVPAWVN